MGEERGESTVRVVRRRLVVSQATSRRTTTTPSQVGTADSYSMYTYRSPDTVMLQYRNI